jgi:hypothetical protein
MTSQSTEELLAVVVLHVVVISSLVLWMMKKDYPTVHDLVDDNVEPTFQCL